MEYTLTFSTRLAAAPNEVWEWITSFSGISREMAPYMTMTFPEGLVGLNSIAIVPGRKLFRSWLKLFGVIPFDYSDMTLVSIDEGEGFVEESPMGSMRQWRHERRITPSGSGSILTDKLTFEPRLFGGLSRAIVNFFFRHRHRKLQRHLGKLA